MCGYAEKKNRNNADKTNISKNCLKINFIDKYAYLIILYTYTYCNID